MLLQKVLKFFGPTIPIFVAAIILSCTMMIKKKSSLVLQNLIGKLTYGLADQLDT